MGENRRALIDALFERVHPEPNSGCWLWCGGLSSEGYGRFTWDKKQGRAHRTSFEAHKGAIGEGMAICHRCDMRSCINPDHLFQGTIADNNRDCLLKGRTVKWNGRRSGENNPRARVTAAAVIEMRTRYSAGGVSYRQLGRQYGLNRDYVKDIIKGMTWKDISA